MLITAIKHEENGSSIHWGKQATYTCPAQSDKKGISFFTLVCKMERNFSSFSIHNSLLVRPSLLAMINMYSHSQELDLPETVSL